MEIYVDYMIVKSTVVADHRTHLQAIFDKLCYHDMKLNLEKCFIDVDGGRFLGFIITLKGI